MKKKILILDDEPDFVEVIKIRLEANGYEVIAASTAKDFFKEVKDSKPDLALIDILMPHMNGYQVCENLKGTKATASLPIVLLTGKELVPGGIIDRCLKLGVDAFLPKLADAQELLATIEKVSKK